MFSREYSQYFFTGNVLEFHPDIASTLNNDYWALREAVRKEMRDPDHKINCFKVIAGIQSTILYHQPFVSPIDSSQNSIKEGLRRVNAEFAWNVSLHVLLSWYDSEFQGYELIITKFTTSKEFVSCREFHLEWSEKVDFKEDSLGRVAFPSYFILAQFWELLYNWLLVYLRSNAISMA